MPETTRVVPKAENETHLSPLYRVLLHNDDINTMDHVVRSLIQVFRFDVAEATAVMREAHEKGVALCAREPKERAEFHRDQLRSFSLAASIEPE